MANAVGRRHVYESRGRYRCHHIGVEACPQPMVTAEVVERQFLELLRWFDIPPSAHEDVAKAIISLCRATGGEDDSIRAESARRELALRRHRTIEMYRDGFRSTSTTWSFRIAIRRNTRKTMSS